MTKQEWKDSFRILALAIAVLAAAPFLLKLLFIYIKWTADLLW